MEGHPLRSSLRQLGTRGCFNFFFPIRGSCYVAGTDLKIAALPLPQLQEFSFRDTHNLGHYHLVEVFKTPRHSSPHRPREPTQGPNVTLPAATPAPNSTGRRAAVDNGEPRPPVSPSPAELGRTRPRRRGRALSSGGLALRTRPPA